MTSRTLRLSGREIIVEPVRLLKRPVLEDLVQDAIHLVGAEQADSRVCAAVEAAQAALAHLPDQERHEADWRLYRALRERLGIKVARPAKAQRPKSRRALAEALFAGEAA